jgi:hypothetical protein
MWRMIHRSFVAGVVSVVLLTFVACSSDGESVAVSSPPTSVSSSDHAADWLAVIASSADPNDLDARRSEVVAALGANDPRVVLSPGACFTGIARRYAGGYVLAVVDRSRQLVEGLIRQTQSVVEWSGPVTSSCID